VNGAAHAASQGSEAADVVIDEVVVPDFADEVLEVHPLAPGMKPEILHKEKVSAAKALVVRLDVVIGLPFSSDALNPGCTPG
jgi:hypothetical protein